MEETSAVAQRAETVPPWARWFVSLFLAAFVVTGLAGIEAWPLTGWRLFSHLRHERVVGWQAVAVDEDGRPEPIRFARLPARYSNFALIMKGFAGLPPEVRRATCGTWLRAVSASRVRLYEVERDVWPRSGGRAATPVTRSLAYECGEA